MIDFTLMTQRNEIVGTLQEMLRIPSVKSAPQTNMPYGKGVFDALQRILITADNMDFDSVNLFSQVGYAEYGDGDEMLAILTHIDVMPAGEGWSVPPFEGTVKDGKIYGRGALDNKGPAVASLYALAALKDNCVTLNKRVRLIFGCDEESGWSDMEFYKSTGQEIPTMAISPDASFPIINAEKGLLHLGLKKAKQGVFEGKGVILQKIDGGDRVNAVPAECTCVLTAEAGLVAKMADLFNEDAPVKVGVTVDGETVTLRTEGISAHGSTPDKGVNAISHLLLFLNQLPLVQNHISDTVYALAQHIGLQTDGKNLGLAQQDDSGALTLNLGYFKADEAGLAVGLDIRYPVTMEKAKVLAAVEGKLCGHKIEELHAMPAHYVPEDSELVRGLKQAYEEVTGEEATCLSTGGATYARAFENAVAFGPLFPGQQGTEHQVDEYMEIDSLLRLGDILANAIVILCGQE